MILHIEDSQMNYVKGSNEQEALQHLEHFLKPAATSLFSSVSIFRNEKNEAENPTSVLRSEKQP